MVNLTHPAPQPQALACKVISKRKLKTASDRAEVRNEISVMKHLEGHPNVVRVVGGYEDREDVHIVMEVGAAGRGAVRCCNKGKMHGKGRMKGKSRSTARARRCAWPCAAPQAMREGGRPRQEGCPRHDREQQAPTSGALRCSKGRMQGQGQGQGAMRWTEENEDRKDAHAMIDREQGIWSAGGSGMKHGRLQECALRTNTLGHVACVKGGAGLRCRV